MITSQKDELLFINKYIITKSKGIYEEFNFTIIIRLIDMRLYDEMTSYIRIK